jgi:hypothetical protein
MILRLEIPRITNTPHYKNAGANSLDIALQSQMSVSLVPSWFDEDEIPLQDQMQRRKRRSIFPFLSAITGVAGLALGIYSAIEVQSVKASLNDLGQHVDQLSTQVRADHESIVKLEKLTGSLYEYTHSQFIQLGEAVNRLNRELQEDVEVISKYLLLSQMQLK